MILSDFCATEDGDPIDWMKEPVLVDELAVATDGHTLLAITADKEDFVCFKLAPANSKKTLLNFLNEIDQRTFTPIQSIGDLVAVKDPQSVARQPYKAEIVDVLGCHVNAAYLGRIIFTKDLEVATDSAKEKLYFRSGDQKGIIMGTRR